MRLNRQRQTVERPHFLLAPESDFVILCQIVDFDYRHISSLEFRLQAALFPGRDRLKAELQTFLI